MKSRWRLSCAQAKNRMPRSRSSVTGRKSSPPMLPTHTLRTPSTGARYASRVASGEIAGLTRVGLPNRTLRGIRSGCTPPSVPRYLRERVEPGLVQGAVVPPGAHQRLRRAVLHDAARVDDQDAVGDLDGREAVRDDQRRPV